MLEARNIWKSFNDRAVLRGINISIRDPGIYVIIGRNGVGKTTLIKILSGILRPSRGEVYINGRNVFNDYGVRDVIGVLFHENILYDELTVHENLDLLLKMYGIDSIKSSTLAYEAYKAFRLDRYDGVRVGHLSYGWRRRLNIVRALLNNPRVLLLDEPILGLDDSASMDVARLIDKVSIDRIILMTLADIRDLELFKALPNLKWVCRLEDGILNVLDEDYIFS